MSFFSQYRPITNSENGELTPAEMAANAWVDAKKKKRTPLSHETPVGTFFTSNSTRYQRRRALEKAKTHNFMHPHSVEIGWNQEMKDRATRGNKVASTLLAKGLVERAAMRAATAVAGHKLSPNQREPMNNLIPAAAKQHRGWHEEGGRRRTRRRTRRRRRN